MTIAWRSLAIDYFADRSSNLLRKAPADRWMTMLHTAIVRNTAPTILIISCCFTRLLVVPSLGLYLERSQSTSIQEYFSTISCLI